MSPPNPPPDPPADEPVTAPRHATRLRSWWRPLVVAALALALVGTGAAIGAEQGRASTDWVSATALVQVVQVQDPMLGGTSPLRSAPGDSQTFVANELAYLSSPAFSAAVGQTLPPGTEPALSVSRQGQSEVLAFSAAAATMPEASSTVDAAVAVYTARRTEQLADQLRTAYDDVQAALDVIATSPVAVSEHEQQSRVALLREQQSQLLRLRHEPVAPVHALGPPIADPPPPAPPWLIGALLGGVLGGLLAAGAAPLLRRRAAPT